MAHAKAITLTNDDLEYLQSLVRQRTIQAQVVDRAKILLYKSQGASNNDIAERLDVNINTVKLCLSKFKEGGVQRALFDDQRKGRPVEITDDAVTWIISLACQRPCDLGYSQELWTLKNLHQHNLPLWLLNIHILNLKCFVKCHKENSNQYNPGQSKAFFLQPLCYN